MQQSNTSPERSKTSPEHSLAFRARRVGAIAAAAGALAIGAAGNVAHELYNNHFGSSGEVTRISPDEDQEYKTEAFIEATAKNEIKLLSQNMHKEASDPSVLEGLEELIKAKNPDAIALQEVQKSQIDELREQFPYMYIVFIKADRLSGNGNALMSPYELKDIKSTTIDGTSKVETATGALTGAYKDISSRNRLYPSSSDPGKLVKNPTKHINDAYQEGRGVISAQIEKGFGGINKNYRVLTSHIAGDAGPNPKHVEQRDKLIEFIIDENIIEGVPFIGCVDWNETLASLKISLKYQLLGTGLKLVPNDIPTSSSGIVIDNCFTHSGSSPDENSEDDPTTTLTVSPDKLTDHNSVDITVPNIPDVNTDGPVFVKDYESLFSTISK